MEELIGTIQMVLVFIFTFFSISGIAKCEIENNKQKNVMTCIEKKMADFDKCEVLRK